MDIITSSHFNQFTEQYGYKCLPMDAAFELFVIYCVISKYIKTETISKALLDDLNVGSGGDWGIDGFAIIVNGKIVSSKQEIKDLLAANGYLKVDIVLIQAKTSEKFHVAELGQTLDGVEYVLKTVMDEKLLPSCNENISHCNDLLKYIYSQSANFQKGINPTINVYYGTCGIYNAQNDFKARIAKAKQSIINTDLISEFQCEILDRKTIVSYYKDTKSKVMADIKVDHKIPLPEVDSIDESYLCLIPFRELKKLIINSEGQISQEIFYDNIRAYQGDNAVNRAMSETLKNGDIKLFSAMNNGITIIAKLLKTTGTNIHIEDYQIVNGCQTCNVLHQNIEAPNIDDLMLSVKLIASKEKEVRNKIIVGNNSQTEVKREQLIALLETQKHIEDYYNAQNKFEKLYYERRSKQYRANETQVPSYKIITIPFQIKAFVSMIIGEPHKVSGYYGSIVEQYDKNGVTVFAPDTNPALYYTSALACYKMTEAFSSKNIPLKYKKVKFHLLLAFRLMCEKGSLYSFNNNKIPEYCDHLNSILCDEDSCKNGFQAAVKLVNEALRRDPIDNDRNSEDFTKKIKKLVRLINEHNAKK